MLSLHGNQVFHMTGVPFSVPALKGSLRQLLELYHPW